MAFTADYKAAAVDQLFDQFGESATLVQHDGREVSRTVIVEGMPQNTEQGPGGSDVNRFLRVKVRESEGDLPSQGDAWRINGEEWAVNELVNDQSRHGVLVTRCTRRQRREIAHDGYRQRSFGG